MDDFFFGRDGDLFVPTRRTVGPWSETSQHGGPPSALLGSLLDRLDPPGLRVARLTIEILRPIPTEPLRVATRVTRPGKRVQFVEATMSAGDVEVARASAWRIRAEERDVTEPMNLDPVPHVPPDDLPAGTFPGSPDDVYINAMEWRFASGTWGERGPATVWSRPRIGLIADEEITPLARVMLAADSGNGLSAELPFTGWFFINTELTVHLTTPPAGEWVCMECITRIDPAGIGLAETTLWDERARIGRGSQSLLIAPFG